MQNGTNYKYRLSSKKINDGYWHYVVGIKKAGNNLETYVMVFKPVLIPVLNS